MTTTVERFVALARRLGAATDPAPVASDLLTRWGEPGRTYHSLRHLHDCLTQLDMAPADRADRDPAEAALWFHDAVYDPRRDDNEPRSADLARAQLTALGVASSVADRVAALVLLTRHRDPPGDPAGRLVCDIDLSILGRPVDEFERYDREIRTEYQWVPEGRYRRERAAVLRGFLLRDPLYLTTWFRDRYEQQSRSNLRRAVARLEEHGPRG